MGGLVSYTAVLAASQAATAGKFGYFSDDNSVTPVSDADGAAQLGKCVFMETLASADADRHVNGRVVNVLVGGKGVVKTDYVESEDEPVVGTRVYCNNSGKFCKTSTNNVDVGSCLAGEDGEGLYTIALLIP